MKCKNCSDKLTFYIQNELPQKEADEITNHLNTCDNCKSIEKELSTLLQEISLIEDINPSDDFLETLTLKAEKELWKSSSSIRNASYRKYIRYSSIAAIFVICIVSTIMFKSAIGLKSKNTTAQSAASTAMADNIKADAKSNGTETGSAGSNSNGGAQLESSMGGLAGSDVTVKADEAQPELALGGLAGSFVTAKVAQQNDQIVYGVPKEVQNTDENVEKFKQQEDNKSTEVVENNSDNTAPEESDIPPVITAITIPSPSTTPLPAQTPAQVKHIELLTQKLEVKSKNTNDALAWIRDQISKINGNEITVLTALDQSTKTSSTVLKKSIADPESDEATNDVLTTNKVCKTITVEVKGDCVEKFTKAMKDYFGEKNIQFEVIENVDADTYRYIISVSE